MALFTAPFVALFAAPFAAPFAALSCGPVLRPRLRRGSSGGGKGWEQTPTENPNAGEIIERLKTNAGNRKPEVEHSKSGAWKARSEIERQIWNVENQALRVER